MVMGFEFFGTKVKMKKKKNAKNNNKGTINPELKKQIIKYMMETPIKSMLEGIDELGDAYESEKVTEDDIANFIDQCESLLLNSV